jgi:hypothetical protein
MKDKMKAENPSNISLMLVGNEKTEVKPGDTFV